MTSEKKRCFTIMIVPHTEEATYSIRLPLYVVQVVVALLVLAVAGFSFLGYAYLKVSAEANEVEALRQINRAQQEEIDLLAIETETMMDHIRDVDSLIEYVTEKMEMEPNVDDIINNNDNNLDNPSDSGIITNPRFPVHSFSEQSTRVHQDTRSSLSPASEGGILERTAGNIEFLKSIVPDRADTLDTLGGYAEKIKARPSIWPARGRLTSGYGMRPIPYGGGYQFHRGVDIIGSHGSPVWATADGVVTFCGYRGAFGNLLIVEHKFGYETYYAHLSGFAVNAGDFVEKGQTIGYMGSTGRTTGTHLHYEVHYNGSTVNPERYMHK